MAGSFAVLLSELQAGNNVAFIHDRAEGARVGAGPAAGALLFFDRGDSVFAFADRSGFASGRAGPLMLRDRAERAGLRAETAVHALRFIDLGPKMAIERDRLHVASPLAAMGQTSPASIGDFHPADRALVASRFDHFEDVGVTFIAP